MATTPRTLQQLVEHAEDPDLIKAAQRAHVELSDRVEEQVARCTALEATAPTNRDLGTLTALYKGVATELAAGDEIAAAARASDADILALHRSFKSIEERHSSFVPSVVDALREGNVPVSAASLLEDLLAAHIGASTVLRNHLLAHAPELENPGATLAAPPAHGTGAARLDAKLINVVGAAVGDAQLVCEHAYDLADPPPVSIADDGSAAACVPAHATHVVRELLKNALVATIEKHVAQHGSNSDAWDEELPPVEIAVAASTISVVDHGGGLEDPDALLRIRPDLSSRYDRLDEPGGSYNSGSQKPISGVGMGLPLCGNQISPRRRRDVVLVIASAQWRGGSRTSMQYFHTGLPMSKLYAAHYGGALTLASADGGAVATLELPTDGDRPEALPAAPDVQNTSFGRR